MAVSTVEKSFFGKIEGLCFIFFLTCGVPSMFFGYPL